MAEGGLPPENVGIMTPTILVILLCLLASLAALVGCGVQALRHGSRRMWAWLLLPAGSLLMLAGFAPASIGVAERTWNSSSVGLWIAMFIGTVGVVFQILGWRAVLRPRLGPGHCQECGYDLAGLDRCPECGAGRGESGDSESG